MSQAYGGTAHRNDGYQSAYDAGLTWFSDGPSSPSMYASPLGLDLSTLTGTIVGGAVAGPAGAATGGSLLSSLLSFASGSAVDQARAARVNYFAQLAANGNVAAMQLILGAPANVSGNEAGMWQTAANAVRTSAPDVYQAAVEAGPAWLVNSGDTATNYPAMRNYVQTWAASHPLTTLTNVAGNVFGGALTPGAPRVGGVSPVVLGAVALGAVLLLSRRRRS